MSEANNNTNYVTTGGPNLAGAIFVAPIGTALPTDAVTALDAAFQSVGYISEDGVTNANGADSEAVREWGGRAVFYNEGEREDTFAFSMIEAMRLQVLKIVYGEDNVSGDLDTGITVKAGSTTRENHVFVIEEILNGDVAKRTVIPFGKLTALEDITYNRTDPVAYPVTISALPDEDGQTHYEYMKKTTTTTDTSTTTT